MAKNDLWFITVMPRTSQIKSTCAAMSLVFAVYQAGWCSCLFRGGISPARMAPLCFRDTSDNGIFRGPEVDLPGYVLFLLCTCLQLSSTLTPHRECHLPDTGLHVRTALPHHSAPLLWKPCRFPLWLGLLLILLQWSEVWSSFIASLRLIHTRLTKFNIFFL